MAIVMQILLLQINYDGAEASAWTSGGHLRASTVILTRKRISIFRLRALVLVILKVIVIPRKTQMKSKARRCDSKLLLHLLLQMLVIESPVAAVLVAVATALNIVST